MTESAKLRLPYLAASQAQKHVTHNEALTLLDTLVQASVIDKDLNTPPGSPSEGDCYIVAAGGTGAWIGWDNRIARYIDGEWRSYLPGAGGGEGWLVYVRDDANLYVLQSGAWTLFASSAQPLDADLTAIAALSPANDQVIQCKAGAWTNRTMAQLMADLGALGQIPFPAAQNPSGNPNTLDDYEEGTFTPSLITTGTAPTGVAYAAQIGQYIKLGGAVIVFGRLALTSKGTGATGQARIGGLPFVSADLGTGIFQGVVNLANGYTLTAGYSWVNISFVANNDVINFSQQGSGLLGAALTWAAITDAFDVRFSGFYIAA